MRHRVSPSGRRVVPEALGGGEPLRARAQSHTRLTMCTASSRCSRSRWSRSTSMPTTMSPGRRPPTCAHSLAAGRRDHTGAPMGAIYSPRRRTVRSLRPRSRHFGTQFSTSRLDRRVRPLALQHGRAGRPSAGHRGRAAAGLNGLPSRPNEESATFSESGRPVGTSCGGSPTPLIRRSLSGSSAGSPPTIRS
jgi:hypothetical protein